MSGINTHCIPFLSRLEGGGHDVSRSPFTRVGIGAPSDGSIEHVGSQGGCTSPIGAAVMSAKRPFASSHRIGHARRKRRNQAALAWKRLSKAVNGAPRP